MMELDRILSLPEFKLKVASVTKDGADIELMRFEDPSIPIGVRHICALVPDVPKAAQELSQQGVEVVRPLAQTSLGFWYTMVRDPNGVIIEFLDPSHKSLSSSWLATAETAEPHRSARHLGMFLFSYIRRLDL